jgi:putative membrane protein
MVLSIQSEGVGDNIMKNAVLCLVVAANFAAISAYAASSPSDFLTDAMKGDNSEIKLGQLAEAKGDGPKVRDFGKTLVDDHTKAKQEVGNAAASMGVTHTDDASPEALAEYTKLSAMKGAAFDREFGRYMVADHKKDIAEFESQAKGGGPASNIAKQQLPTLRKHLAIAESLLQSGAQP